MTVSILKALIEVKKHDYYDIFGSTISDDYAYTKSHLADEGIMDYTYDEYLEYNVEIYDKRPRDQDFVTWLEEQSIRRYNARNY